jgi:hypothetical protein
MHVILAFSFSYAAILLRDALSVRPVSPVVLAILRAAQAGEFLGRNTLRPPNVAARAMPWMERALWKCRSGTRARAPRPAIPDKSAHDLPDGLAVSLQLSQAE